MKLPLLLSLSLSIFATSAIAMPVAEQVSCAEMKAGSQAGHVHVAQEDCISRQYKRVAEHDPERVVQQYQRV
jgi:hypothetical protein